MSSRVWGVFIPPMGAAREVMLSLYRSMEERGEKVYPVDVKAFEESYENMVVPEADCMVNELQNNHWVCKALDESWTHCIVGGLAPVMLRTLLLLKKVNVTTVHWFYEDYRIAKYWSDVASWYDLFCCVQKEPLQTEVGEPFRYLPTATGTTPMTQITPLESRKYDGVFIGVPSSYRVKILESLIAAGFSVIIAGPEWEQVPSLMPYVAVNGWVDQSTTEQLYGMVRCGFNLSKDDPSMGREQSQVSPRLYDIAACGAIPVTEYLPLGDELYEELTMKTFIDSDDLHRKISDVLSGEITVHQLRQNRYIVETKHQYIHRFEQIVQWCDELDA